MNQKNIILTGIPRSGTTLTCHLLNKLANTVALHEPMNVFNLRHIKTLGGICREIERFFMETRESILTKGKAITKHVGGKIPENPIANQYQGKRLRKSIVKTGFIEMDKTLSAEFMLIIKHPVAFTAILEDLMKHFISYAVIRNPLSVISSWNSVSLPVADGHAPAAEGLDQALSKGLKKIKDKFDRQIYLLSWFYEKYRAVLPNSSIIRYEDIVASGGKSLSVITAEANTLNEKLESKNKNTLYDSNLMAFLGEKLLKKDGAFWDFYSKESVEDLVRERDHV